MGALPSRETHERGLYSHRHGRNRRNEIILIPLTSTFFPSPQCELFQHLYKARERRTAKYYYRAVRSARTSPESDYFCTTNAIADGEAFTQFEQERQAARRSAKHADPLFAPLGPFDLHAGIVPAAAITTNAMSSSSLFAATAVASHPHVVEPTASSSSVRPDTAIAPPLTMTSSPSISVPQLLVQPSASSSHLSATATPAEGNTSHLNRHGSKAESNDEGDSDDDDSEADFRFRSFTDSPEGLYQFLIADNDLCVYNTDAELREAYLAQVQQQNSEQQAMTGHGTNHNTSSDAFACDVTGGCESVSFDAFLSGYLAAKRYMKGRPLHTHYASDTTTSNTNSNSNVTGSVSHGRPTSASPLPQRHPSLSSSMPTTNGSPQTSHRASVVATAAGGKEDTRRDARSGHESDNKSRVPCHTTSPAAYYIRPVPCAIVSRYDSNRPAPVDDPLYTRFDGYYVKVMGMFGLFPATVPMRVALQPTNYNTRNNSHEASHKANHRGNVDDSYDEGTQRVEQHVLKGTMFVDRDIGDQILGNMVMLATHMYVRQCMEARLRPEYLPALPFLMRIPLSNVPLLQFVREFRVRLRSLLEAGTAQAGQKPMHAGMNGFNETDLSQPHDPTRQRLQEEGYLFESDVPPVMTANELFYPEPQTVVNAATTAATKTGSNGHRSGSPVMQGKAQGMGTTTAAYGQKPLPPQQQGIVTTTTTTSMYPAMAPNAGMLPPSCSSPPAAAGLTSYEAQMRLGMASLLWRQHIAARGTVESPWPRITTNTNATGRWPVRMVSGFNVQSSPLHHAALNYTGYCEASGPRGTGGMEDALYHPCCGCASAAAAMMMMEGTNNNNNGQSSPRTLLPPPPPLPATTTVPMSGIHMNNATPNAAMQAMMTGPAGRMAYWAAQPTSGFPPSYLMPPPVTNTSTPPGMPVAPLSPSTTSATSAMPHAMQGTTLPVGPQDMNAATRGITVGYPTPPTTLQGTAATTGATMYGSNAANHINGTTNNNNNSAAVCHAMQSARSLALLRRRKQRFRLWIEQGHLYIWASAAYVRRACLLLAQQLNTNVDSDAVPEARCWNYRGLLHAGSVVPPPVQHNDILVIAEDMPTLDLWQGDVLRCCTMAELQAHQQQQQQQPLPNTITTTTAMNGVSTMMMPSSSSQTPPATLTQRRSTSANGTVNDAVHMTTSPIGGVGHAAVGMRMCDGQENSLQHHHHHLSSSAGLNRDATLATQVQTCCHAGAAAPAGAFWVRGSGGLDDSVINYSAPNMAHSAKAEKQQAQLAAQKSRRMHGGGSCCGGTLPNCCDGKSSHSGHGGEHTSVEDRACDTTVNEAAHGGQESNAALTSDAIDRRRGTLNIEEVILSWIKTQMTIARDVAEEDAAWVRDPHGIAFRMDRYVILRLEHDGVRYFIGVTPRYLGQQRRIERVLGEIYALEEGQQQQQQEQEEEGMKRQGDESDKQKNKTVTTAVVEDKARRGSDVPREQQQQHRQSSVHDTTGLRTMSSHRSGSSTVSKTAKGNEGSAGSVRPIGTDTHVPHEGMSLGAAHTAPFTLVQQQPGMLYTDNNNDSSSSRASGFVFSQCFSGAAALQSGGDSAPHDTTNTNNSNRLYVPQRGSTAMPTTTTANTAVRPDAAVHRPSLVTQNNNKDVTQRGRHASFVGSEEEDDDAHDVAALLLDYDATQFNFTEDA